MHHYGIRRRLSHNNRQYTTHPTPNNKLQKFAKWSHMDLNLSKCVIIRCPYKSKFKPNTFKAYIQSQNITYKTKNFPTLIQNEPYIYLGI